MASSEIDACRLMFIVPRSPKKNTSATSTQRGVDSGSNIITTTVQARIAKDILMTRARLSRSCRRSTRQGEPR